MQTIFLYLDPGSGAMIVQALIAGALGVVMFVKNIKKKVLGFFGIKTSDADDESNE